MSKDYSVTGHEPQGNHLWLEGWGVAIEAMDDGRSQGLKLIHACIHSGCLKRRTSSGLWGTRLVTDPCPNLGTAKSLTGPKRAPWLGNSGTRCHSSCQHSILPVALFSRMQKFYSIKSVAAFESPHALGLSHLASNVQHFIPILNEKFLNKGPAEGKCIFLVQKRVLVLVRPEDKWYSNRMMEDESWENLVLAPRGPFWKAGSLLELVKLHPSLARSLGTRNWLHEYLFTCNPFLVPVPPLSYGSGRSSPRLNLFSLALNVVDTHLPLLPLPPR